MPKRIPEKPSKEVSLVEAKNQPPANEARIEREAVPVPSDAEICAVACALGLDPFDKKSQALAQKKLDSFEYARVREEVFNRMQSDFFVGMDAIFVRRPSPEALATQPPENRQITSLIREAFLTIHAPCLSAIVDDWVGETPKADRGEKREIPQEIADAIYRRLDSISSIVRADTLEVKVRSHESRDILIADGLMRIGMYEIHHRSEQGPKRYIDDFLVSLDHQGPRSQAKNEAASLAATWSWLGPIANKAAAYLGVKFSEKENESEHRPPYYASVVKNGVLIPQKAEAPYVALLVELCREGYDEGLELRKEHRAEAKAFDEMQRERKEDLGALDADVKETLRLIGLLSDRVETLYRRERQDFRDSESGVAHAQLQQERDVLGKRIKELKDQRSSLKGGDGLLARARELYYHSEIHQIDVELAQLAERVSNIMRLEAVKEKKIMEAAWSERLFTVYRARVSDLHIRAGMIQDQLPAIRQPYLVGRDPSPFQKVRMQLTELLGELTQLQEPLEDLDTREKLEKRGDWSPLADQELVDLQAGVDLYQDEEKSKRRQRRTSPKGARRAPVSRAKSDMN